MRLNIGTARDTKIIWNFHILKLKILFSNVPSESRIDTKNCTCLCLPSYRLLFLTYYASLNIAILCVDFLVYNYVYISYGLWTLHGSDHLLNRWFVECTLLVLRQSRSLYLRCLP